MAKKSLDHEHQDITANDKTLRTASAGFYNPPMAGDLLS